jgi:hypothetical protein
MVPRTIPGIVDHPIQRAGAPLPPDWLASVRSVLSTIIANPDESEAARFAARSAELWLR